MSTQNNREIVYEFPELPSGATLNTRGSWHRPAQAAADAKEEALGSILAQRNGRGPALLRKTSVNYHFYLPDRRRRDLDNLVGAAKPYLDALVQAGELTDDSAVVIHALTVQSEYRRGQPGFRITITPVEEPTDA